MKLILLRHGRTEANERKLYCGKSDVPLSPKGREELHALRESIVYPDITGFRKITSGMRRANETMEILFGAEPDEQISGLREMDFGRFEMHSYEELKNDPDYQAWITDTSGQAATPGGESAAAFNRRVIEAAQSLHEDAVVVCHGGVIAALMAEWFPEENRNMYQWQPSGGLGYFVDFSDGGRSFRAINADAG